MITTFSWEEDLANLPGIRAGMGVFQNKFHDFDVYTHTREVVRHVKERVDLSSNLIASAWLHDVGKPAVAIPMDPNDPPVCDSRGHQYHQFKGHEEVGAVIVENMNERFFSSRGLNKGLIGFLVKNHNQPMKALKELRKTPEWRQYQQIHQGYFHFLNEIGNTMGDAIMTLFLGDVLAHRNRTSKDLRDEAEIFLFYSTLTDNGSALKKLFEFQRRKYSKK